MTRPIAQWSIKEIESITNARWLIEPKQDTIEFAGASIDTRTTKSNQFFFAFVGEHTDGHQYLTQAQEAGASLCIVSHQDRVPQDIQVPVLIVDDVLLSITQLAQIWRPKLNATVIGITGSNGKTTTCRILHAICKQAGPAWVSQKSFNNALGVPITILNTPTDATFLIAELGTSSKGEIAQRSTLLKPDIGIITSIGHAHLEELTDIAGVAQEKAAIIKSLSDQGMAIIPQGVDELDAAISTLESNCQIIRVNTQSAAKVTKSTNDSTDFVLEDQHYHLNMIGAHNIANATLAIAVAKAMGIDEQCIKPGLSSALLPAMRFERIEITTQSDPITIFNDAYNANPDSIRAALATFDSMPKPSASTRIAILGSMLELGDASNTQHRQLVDELINYPSIDRFILVGDAYPSASSSDPKIIHFPSCDKQSMQTIADSIKPASSTLLKGSRGIALEQLIELIQSNHTSEHTTHA